jgi:hypothetical protein
MKKIKYFISYENSASIAVIGGALFGLGHDIGSSIIGYAGLVISIIGLRLFFMNTN